MMSVYLLTISLILHADAYIIQNDNNNIVSVSKCLQEILNNYVDFKDHLAIFNENIKMDRVFHTAHTKVIYNFKPLQFNLEKAKGYLIILKSGKLRSILKYFSLLSSWNPRAKFIVMSDTENKEILMDQAIQYLIVDLLVLEVIGDTAYLYSWDPYVMLCRKYMNVTYLDSCQNGVFENKIDLFNKKLTNTWKGCTLKALPMLISPYVFNDRNKELDGLEIRTLDAIKTQMGFEIDYLQHNFKTWGLRKSNGRYSDMFDMLQSYDADIVLGMYLIVN